MSVLTAVVLGLVQGIAEFLPISSSGHRGAFTKHPGREQRARLFRRAAPPRHARGGVCRLLG